MPPSAEQALHGADVELTVRACLSPEHRDAPGTGCPIAALAAEVARPPRATRHTFTSHNEPTSTRSRPGSPPGEAGRSAARTRRRSWGSSQERCSSRATPDRVESDAILEAGIRAALRLAGSDA